MKGSKPNANNQSQIRPLKTIHRQRYRRVDIATDYDTRRTGASAEDHDCLARPGPLPRYRRAICQARHPDSLFARRRRPIPARSPRDPGLTMSVISRCDGAVIYFSDTELQAMAENAETVVSATQFGS